MTTEMKTQIERFLDEFMKMEYKERDHMIAREHYRKVFLELIPKFFVLPETKEKP